MMRRVSLSLKSQRTRVGAGRVVCNPKPEPHPAGGRKNSFCLSNPRPLSFLQPVQGALQREQLVGCPGRAGLKAKAPQLDMALEAFAPPPLLYGATAGRPWLPSGSPGQEASEGVATSLLDRAPTGLCRCLPRPAFIPLRLAPTPLGTRLGGSEGRVGRFIAAW